GLESLQGGRGIGAVHKQLHLRRMACHQFAGKVRRDIERSVRAALAHLALQLLQSLHFADYAKTLGIYETIDQLATLRRSVFVQNKHRHVFDVVVERVAERNHFDQRREKEKKQRQRVAPDDDELLEQDCAESAKQLVFHGCAALRLVKPL